MKESKAVLALMAGLFITQSSLFGQTITMENFLSRLKEQHPLFEKERLTAQIEKEEQSSYLGAQDWNLFSSIGFSHEEPAMTFTEPERTDAFYASFGVARVFWKTGGRLSASLSSYRADMRGLPYDYPDSYHQNQLAVAYTHPLLQNRNGSLDRLEHALKQFDIDFSDVQALENQEDFLAGSAAKFLDWAFLTQQRDIVQERLGLSEEELDRTKKKREANLVEQADVIRAEDAVRIWRQSQMLVESQWNALRAELAVLLQDDQLNDLNPEFDLYEIEQLIPLAEAILQMKESSRLIQGLGIRLEQLQRVRKGFQETSKPELYAMAELNTKSADKNLGDSFEMDKPDAVVGLQFSLPFGNRTARAQISKTDLQMAQLKKELDDVVLTLTSTLTNLHIQIEQLKDVLTLNQDQIESAQERTREELKLYNQGRGDLTFVILSRDNEQNARLTLATNALTYHRLIVAYRSLMDQLHE